MKRLYNFMLAVLLIVMLSACGMQAGTHTENNVANGEEQQQKQDGDNSMAGDSSFNFETKTVVLNSGVRLIDTAYMYHNL